MALLEDRPCFTREAAGRIAAGVYGIDPADIAPLPSDRDQNFLLTTGSGERCVLKIANAQEDRGILEMQNAAMAHLGGGGRALAPSVIPGVGGEPIGRVTAEDGKGHFVRLLTWLPGRPLAEAQPHTPLLLRRLGEFTGRLSREFASFECPAAHRRLHWDLRHAGEVIREHLPLLTAPRERELVEHFLEYIRTHVEPALPMLRRSIVHGDGNDYNMLVTESGGAGPAEIAGIIDFGDMVHSHTVFEPAIVLAYALMGKEDPLASACEVVSGYHGAYPLEPLEIELLYSLVAARLCVSLAVAAYQRRFEPENDYLVISRRPALRLLEQWRAISYSACHARLREACGLGGAAVGTKAELLARRRRHLGMNLSLSYEEPVRIVRGAGQYLYDENGRAYLDVVNNVCHVGHSHPRVVRAAAQQMATLNTNTRYLHDNILRYAERLAATLPEPLHVCFFVNSGSEANDLALRLAAAHTGRRDMIVVDVAYHGNLASLVDISPYKHNGPGGRGTPAHVQVVPMPDGYRGRFKGLGFETGRLYAQDVGRAVAAIGARGTGPCAFIAESIISCGGQVVLPAGYLEESYRQVRAAGGVCIADEVQVGFGRVGSHFWAFETQGVVPDIVTMGKPAGNGHPLAIVVTTPAIAASFHNGMEYFNTFGGNPVSCAAGLAVLDVIRDQRLQENALRTGAHLLEGLHRLQARHELVGDARGLGLFAGIELVRDRDTLEPAGREAGLVANRMKARGFLLSTDGPFHNVIKMKPPLVFTGEDADRLVSALDDVLSDIEA